MKYNYIKKIKNVLIIFLILSIALCIDIYASNVIGGETKKIEINLERLTKHRAFAELVGSKNLFEVVTLGHYEQDNNLSNGPEPIEWFVVKKDDSKALLVSRYILDCKSFHDIPDFVTWENCTLRNWLNYVFLNTAFDEDEKTFIEMVKNQNKQNEFYNTDCGDETYDKVFCLSFDEAVSYFEFGDNYDEKLSKCTSHNSFRKCMATPYAIKKGVRVINKDVEDKGCGNYWLRTLGCNSTRKWYNDVIATYYATIVQEHGNINLSGTAVHSIDDGVRPCIWVSYK